MPPIGPLNLRQSALSTGCHPQQDRLSYMANVPRRRERHRGKQPIVRDEGEAPEMITTTTLRAPARFCHVRGPMAPIVTA
jgi:hypothetical protein